MTDLLRTRALLSIVHGCCLCHRETSTDDETPSSPSLLSATWWGVEQPHVFRRCRPLLPSGLCVHALAGNSQT
uniref:Putative secreted protein n=1 Tax=Anopheles marajoara TaxID=58244 RepID=A0A2M4CDM0_9DIPT